MSAQTWAMVEELDILSHGEGFFEKTVSIL